MNGTCIFSFVDRPEAGIPTYRIDERVPANPYTDKYQELSDFTNVKACIQPSIFTQYSMSHRDFFRVSQIQVYTNVTPLTLSISAPREGFHEVVIQKNRLRTERYSFRANLENRNGKRWMERSLRADFSRTFKRIFSFAEKIESRWSFQRMINHFEIKAV